jgi:MoxR-like ATPase
MTVTAEQASWFEQTFETLVSNVTSVVIGKRRTVELAFTALISEGHLLLEDVPGTGKTSLARALGNTMNGTTSRIQFTPDLLPGDVTGITVYDQKQGEFEFHAGPVFANVLLADEINRASPKTQSALLEVMEEGQVTVDGVTRKVGVPFLVVATQNPIEQAGTYRLPEAQLDRFMMKTSLGYPDHAATIAILESTATSRPIVESVITPQQVLAMVDLAREVHVDPLVLDYVSRIIEATRAAKEVRLGSSVRGAMALLRGARTWALAKGRTFVTPDDVKALAEPVLSHRIVLDPEAEFDGVTAQAVIGQIMLETQPPSEDAFV